MSQPTLETPRLILRPFCHDDASSVQHLAGQWDIADTTLTIPHPYGDGMAEQWIDTHEPGYAAKKMATFAVVLRSDNALAGAVGLRIDSGMAKAELGYWIGKPYWNSGYATEAARAVLAFAFEQLGLNRVQARHFARNPASGRVMKKVGMRSEGVARQGAMKWGKFEDLVHYGILREDWLELKRSSTLP